MTRLFVTDHAIVRYLERVLHLDLAKIREDIVEQVEHGATLPVKPTNGGTLIMGPKNKAAMIVRQDSIVTVLGVREIRESPWMGVRQ